LPLPWSIAFILNWLRKALGGEGRVRVIRVCRKDLGEAFRADAKAEGMEVAVGGWECLAGRRPEEARWYALKLNKTNAPWAFSKGEPFRTIASLELFATLLSVVAFADRWGDTAGGVIRITGATDNGGTPHVLSRLMTSKFPLVVILAELAEQLRARDLELSLLWTPREQNEAADDLTNGKFGRFTAGNRVEIKLEEVMFKVLPEMMQTADALYQEVQHHRSQGTAAKREREAAQKGKPKRLRERDPW